MQQKGRTLDFWDDFYQQKSDEAEEGGGSCHQEWILQPSEELLHLLARHSSSSTPAGWSDTECGCRSSSSDDSAPSRHARHELRFLEIGCGTSLLAREFYKYLKRSAGNGCATVEGVASDVSAVCIEKNQKRDKQFLREEAGESSFRYTVLNVQDEPIPEDLRSRFHVILDKGCLDTFLFRTRHRGGRRKEMLLKSVLDNLYLMLSDDDDTPSCSSSCFLMLSPRSGIRPLREHPGFVCDKHELDASILRRGELDGPKFQDRENAPLYLHVCRKQPGYQVSSSLLPQNVGTLTDEDECPSCGLTFETFRGGHQSLNGRGYHVWYREWTGHVTHCKGTGTALSKKGAPTG